MNNKNSWMGIWALALGVSGIMVGEFLPSGLLTPMSNDLNITEGVPGQTVTVTSVFAVIASLLSAYFSRSFDRKNVLIFFSFLTMTSSLIVGASSNYQFILFGRILLGIALGGFWSMATAIALRLVEEENVSKALGIIFGSASFSGMMAAPLGSFLGELIGWRNVFYLNSLVSIIGLLMIIFFLPKLQPISEVKLRTIIDVIKLPYVKVGMFAIALTFGGRFGIITYLRPYLEQLMNLSAKEVSSMFLIFDFSYFMGSIIISKHVAKNLGLSMTLSPLLLSLIGVALIFTIHSLVLTSVLICFLGLSYAPVPVSWSTWGAKIAPDHTETIGGLYVSSVQIAAAIASYMGGLVLDYEGPIAVFLISSSFWMIAAFIVIIFVKTTFHTDIIE